MGVRIQVALSLTLDPRHSLLLHIQLGVRMTETEETPVVAPKEEEVVKLSNSFKEACVLAKSELLRNLILLTVSVYFILKYNDSDLPTDNFLLINIFVPLFVYNTIMILCTAYYIFALTQNTVRYLYVEVFYVNIFRKLVVIFFCTYMLVVIFSPHHFYVSSSREMITFHNAYLIFAAAILSYALFDSALVITYICALYFRAQRLRSFLSKYWFVRLTIMIGVDLLLVCYYLHCLFVHFNPIFLIYMLLVLGKAIILMWFLKREICVPMSWKMKDLDDQKVPDSAKVKQAVRIMAMKAEVKEVADGAGAGAA